MTKKIFFLISFFFLIFLLTGCGQPVMMDQLNQQGLYPYHNDFFNFNLPLPSAFLYYQTQRVAYTGYTDVDIFVPTSDTNYAEQLPGYALPVIVRVYDKSAFSALSTTTAASLVKVGEKGNKVYTLVFWNQIPSDWKNVWTDEMKQQLIKSFKFN
jgi:hypothetical protein